MSNPQRFINRMIVFLALAVAALAFAYDIVFRMFMYNPILNGLILGVLLIGIFYVMRRVWMLKPEIRWIEGLRTSKPGYAIQAAPLPPDPGRECPGGAGAARSRHAAGEFRSLPP